MGDVTRQNAEEGVGKGDNLGQEVDPHSGLVRPVLDEVHGLPGTQLGLIAGGRRLLLV